MFLHQMYEDDNQSLYNLNLVIRIELKKDEILMWVLGRSKEEPPYLRIEYPTAKYAKSEFERLIKQMRANGLIFESQID